MFNYRDGKERIKIDKFGSLYLDRWRIEDGHRPIIYIGGQMEHRFHIVEQTGFTGDVGHNLFDGSWFYDYPLGFGAKSKEDINAFNFAYNLLMALDKADIKEVDLVTMSYGGMIAAIASDSSRIHKVAAVHPPYLGVPYLNKDIINSKIEKLNKEQKRTLKIINQVINQKYGFVKENANGLFDEDLKSIVDFSKIKVVGSNINIENENNIIIKMVYDLIYALTGDYSDGIVIHNKSKYNELGMDYIEEEISRNHFEAQSEDNLEEARRLILK